MVEALNEALMSQQQQASLLQIADTVSKLVKQKQTEIWTLSLQELRSSVEQSIVQTVTEAPEGCDKLISLLFFAANCYRRHTIFEPFPSHFVDQGEKDFAKMVCVCVRVCVSAFVLYFSFFSCPSRVFAVQVP